MKLISPIISLVAATLLFSFALSTPVSDKADEVRLGRKAFRPHGAPAAEHVPITNAERFARGLPPLSPSKSRNRGSPTRRDVVSPLPPVTYQGYIEVDVSGSFAGYIAAKGTSDSYYGITSSDSDTKLIVTVSLPAGQTSGSSLDLLTVNSQNSMASSAPYLGFASTSTDFLSSGDMAFLTATAQSRGGPSAGTSASGDPYIESSVWSVNVVTGEMSAVWTNGDGSISDYVPYYYQGVILLAVPGATVPPVTFKFIPILI